MKILSVLLVLLIAGPQRFGDANFTLTRAYFRGGGIDFDSPIAVDWEALARQRFGDALLANPDRNEVRKRWNEIGQSATFDFDNVVSNSFKTGYFYLLAESGSGPLVVNGLTGHVTYATNEAATEISTPTFSGVARGTGTARPLDAGFVVYSASRLNVSATEGLTRRTQEPRLTVRQEGSDNVVSLAYGGKVMAVGRKPVGYPEVQYSALVTFGPRSPAYLVIRWAPDSKCAEACCEHGYSIYRVGTTAESVLENFYDCDV